MTKILNLLKSLTSLTYVFGVACYIPEEQKGSQSYSSLYSQIISINNRLDKSINY